MRQCWWEASPSTIGTSRNSRLCGLSLCHDSPAGVPSNCEAGRPNNESGQTSAEFSLVLAAIAIGCFLALVFLGGGILDLFDTTGNSVPRSAPPPAPPPAPALTWPTTLEECEDGGWQDFPQFSNEEECVDYVDTLTP